jgi:Beta/Gamma crystallin
MSSSTKQSKSIFQQISGLEEITSENAALISGGDLILYNLPNFRGRSVIIKGSDANLGKPPGVRDFDNKASSLRITDNGTWSLYDLINFRGRFISLRGRTNIPNIRGRLNNSISSVRRSG